MHFTICYNVNGGKMKTYTYTPKGVCSSKMTFILDGDIIKDLKVTNGCPGNLLGISSLIKDKNIDESQKDITRFIFSKNDILGKYDTICFTDGSNILELSEDILDMLDKSLLDKSEVAATKE